MRLIIKLKIFPLSLKEKARNWFHDLAQGSIEKWREMVEAFLTKYFPPNLLHNSEQKLHCLDKAIKKHYTRLRIDLENFLGNSHNIGTSFGHEYKLCTMG